MKCVWALPACLVGQWLHDTIVNITSMHTDVLSAIFGLDVCVGADWTTYPFMHISRAGAFINVLMFRAWAGGSFPTLRTNMGASDLMSYLCTSPTLGGKYTCETFCQSASRRIDISPMHTICTHSPHPAEESGV